MKTMETEESEPMTIRWQILGGDCLRDGEPTRAALERLGAVTRAALEAEFPGAEVEIEICPHTSGAGRRYVSSGSPSDQDRADLVASRSWEQWSRSITDADTEEV
jgi:hypothetical protein